MPIVQVIILAIVQGLAELLPVSSSAHVVVAEKLLGYALDRGVDYSDAPTIRQFTRDLAQNKDRKSVV